MITKKTIIETTNKETKIVYLLQIGLFKEDVLKEMDENQLNELVETATEIKGF
jgi:hypothetical protein